MVNLEKNKFKLIYYDKNGNALDLLILYLEFTQDLFDNDGKFGSFRIVAFGSIDRDVNEIISDNEKEPIVILSLEQEFLHDEINGKFVLPLYVKSANVFAKYDETNTIYQFFCRPFVYAIFHSRSESFSLRISPKEMGKLPNIRELLEEFVGRQPILHSGGSVSILPASTRTFDLIKTGAKRDAQKVEVQEERSIEEAVEGIAEKLEKTMEKLEENVLQPLAESFSNEEAFIRLIEKVPMSAEFIRSANKFLQKAENMVKEFEKYEDLITADLITLKEAAVKKVVKLNKSLASKKLDEKLKKNLTLDKIVKHAEDKKKKINELVESIKKKQEGLLKKADFSAQRFKDFTKSICSMDSYFTELLRRIARLFEKFGDVLKNFLSKLTSFVSNLINGLLNAFEKLKSVLFEAIRGIVRSIADKVFTLLNSIEDCADDFMRTVSEFNEMIFDLANKIRNFPSEVKVSAIKTIDDVRNSVISLSQINLPTLSEVIKIIEGEGIYARNRLDSVLSSILGINVFGRKTKEDVLIHLRPIVDATVEISDAIPIEKILDSIADRIENETQLLQPIIIEDGNGIKPEELIEKIDDIIRPIIKEEFDKVTFNMENDVSVLGELFTDFVLNFSSFLEDIKNSVSRDVKEPLEAALLIEVNELLNSINKLNIPEEASSLAFSFDPNHPIWRETFQTLEDLITIYLSLLLLNWQKAQALLLYGDSITTPSVVGGVVDPIKSMQIVFGIEEAELVWFDKVTKKIANKLNDISYSIYSGNIYTALNKMIRDLCPSPVSSFLSIVYYYKDGKSHAFFRYRLYPGAFELGRSDLEICSSGCPIQLSPENMYALKKFLMRRKPDEGQMTISNNFAGLPAKVIEISPTMLGAHRLWAYVEAYKQLGYTVFEGTSLVNDKRTFIIVPTPEAASSTAEIPVQVEHLSYNGLMVGKFFGDMANSLVKNALLKTKFSFIGKDAYLLFLLLWPGDIVTMNVLSLVDVTELPLKSPHMFLPRFLVTKKTFYYLNLDYKDVMAQYVKPKTTYPLYIEFNVVSNDDGMKTPKDLSGQSFFDAVGKAYEKCLVLGD